MAFVHVYVGSAETSSGAVGDTTGGYVGSVVAVVGAVVAAVVDAVLGITVGAVVAFVAGAVVGAEVNTVVGASVTFVAGAVVDSVVAAVLGFVSVLPAGFVVAATPVPTVPFVPGATGIVAGAVVPSVPLVAGLVPGFGFVAIVDPAGISVADITVLSVEVVPSIGFAADSPVDSCIESAVGPVVGISVCVVIATVETGTAAEGFWGFTGFLSGNSRITTTAIAKAATAKSHRISFFCGGIISFSVKGFMQ